MLQTRHRRSTKKIRVKRKSNKERPLRAYLGTSHPVDVLYYASSGMCYTTSPIYKQFITEEGALAIYRDGFLRRAKSAGSFPSLGYEQLVSSAYGKSVMQNCTHFKLRAFNVPYHVSNTSYTTPSQLYYNRYWRLPFLTMDRSVVAKTLGRAATVPVGDDLGFSSRAFWSMRPKFEGDVSLINSIFELKDFKDVVNISKLVRTFKSLASSAQMTAFRREFNRLRRENNVNITVSGETSLKSYSALTDTPSDVAGHLARDVSGSAAAAVLTMNLAIKPTVQDYLAITAQLLTTAKEAQETFASYGEIGSSSHFSEVDIYADVKSGSQNDYYQKTGTQIVVKKTATMRSFYDYKMRSQNEALIKYWGFTGSAEALWNMLPLSFVLDYVYTVGKTLSYMNSDDNVRILKTEYCESVKVTTTSGIHFARTPLMHSLVYDGKFFERPSTDVKRLLLVSGTECTRYTRKVMEPYKGPALPKLKKPSTTQAVNVLALLRCFLG